MRTKSRTQTIPLLILACVLPGAAATDAPPDASLARYAPADTGLFVEIRRCEDLLIALTEPQLWSALAEVAGQPAGVEDAVSWREHIRATLDMDPAEAIRTLFVGGVAFVGEGPLRSQDAVVLCRPATEDSCSEFLKRWNAKLITGETSDQMPVPAYRLGTNVGMASHDGTLIFGDAGLHDGMFRRALALVGPDPPASLADDVTLRELLQRVPPDPDGLLFARMGAARRPVLLPPTSAPSTQSSTQPTTRASVPRLSPVLPNLPGPLRGASHVLLALHREGRLLHFSAVGDADNHGAPRSAHLTRLIQTLPRQTLAAWGGHVDYAALRAAVEALPRQHMARVALTLHQQTGVWLEKILASPTGVALGFVHQRSNADAPPAPAVALLLTADDAPAAHSAVTDLVMTSASLYALMALQRGLPTVPPIEEMSVAGVDVAQWDISAPIAAMTGGSIAEMQICWALDGNVLIVATHAEWLARILESRHGDAPQLAEVFKLSKRPPNAASDSLAVFQAGPAADLGAMWLRHLERVAPKVVDEAWWRSHQPSGTQLRLGIDVAEEPEQNRLRIVSVGTNVPASGLLEPGDRIIGHDQAFFATEHPIREMQRALKMRPHARWIDLIIEHDGDRVIKRIPLPFVDPIAILRRWIAIGKLVQRVVYSDDLPGKGGPRGFLTVELRQSDTPLFDLTPATTMPAAASAETQPGRSEN